MKRKVLAVLLASTLLMAGCVDGDTEEYEENTKNQVLLNSGSECIYTFRDERTGVWYIANMRGGVTPRLNLDGTLYKSR